jgi:hypothetical protein
MCSDRKQAEHVLCEYLLSIASSMRCQAAFIAAAAMRCTSSLRIIITIIECKQWQQRGYACLQY